MSLLHVACKGIAILLILLNQLAAQAQDSTSVMDKVINFPDTLLSSLNKKASSIESKLDRGTEKYLSILQRQEKRLKRKLLKKDSALAEQVFGDIDAKYNQLRITSGIEAFKDVNPSYNGLMCNCSDFAKEGVLYAAPPGNPVTNFTENIGSTQAATPNQLYKAAAALPNAVIVKDPGTKVQKNFIEARSGGGVRQSKAEKKVD